ncbi:MAG: TadE/TadG family type IV pilus assembly protein [Actinomycetota bacterium]
MLRSPRGSSTVEFVLVLPLLLIVLLGVVQVGLVMRDQLRVSQAVRDAAREASVTLDQGAIMRAAERSGLDGARLELSVAREGGAPGDPVAVVLTYHEPVVVPLVAWLFPDGFVLSATTTMRQEVAA